MGLACTNIYYPSLRQALAEDAYLGRVTASTSWLILGAVPIDTAAAGALQGLIGLRWTLVCEAIGLLFGVLWVLGARIRNLRTLPDRASIEMTEESPLVSQADQVQIEA
ncbi:hypothetical protein [Ktedonospora formicarum]|uniref:hypothetical protein n=1 Tax=Ktedonospora formicarum TaxID=2778364 RepID=UPI001C68D2D3|nr:hypothetical protein [Ktedonospora formicarum]